MDGALMENLKQVPKFLKNAWDCVFIVSGSGKVRIGKSSMALQMAYFIAWLLVGGDKKLKKTPVPFTLDNVVFTPKDLMKLASTLPKHSVILYDEGRAGLDSARAMESLNKIMIDFFQECGQYQHVIIIVLPNFHRLKEDIAVARSLFLVDVYTGKNYSRGFFKFFNERQKENLYAFGKARIGIYNKYMATNPSFRGRFTKYLPVSKKDYEDKKLKALREKSLSRNQTKQLLSRNFAVYNLYSDGMHLIDLAKTFNLHRNSITNIINEEKLRRTKKIKEYQDEN